ncbi:MAG: HipA domain-containing protein [Bacteroidales bacterium]|nr:HipA domain-containing protein [Bacteroidales bacterium]
MQRRCLHCLEELSEQGDFHASCSRKFFGTPYAPVIPYSLDQMADLAKHVVERSVSVPGFQPKLSMSLVREVKDRGRFRLTVVGALGGNYIFKPPVKEYPELPQNEHVTMIMARLFGIKTVPSSLVRLQSGELSYITRRVDRSTDGKKIHMLDMFQVLEAYDKYRGSYEKIGKALGRYSSNSMLDKLLFFELLVFSYLTGNTDMHLKNFSMIESNSGWILAPAYDLLNVMLVIPSEREEMALSLSGRKSKLTRKSFDRFGYEMQLNEKQVGSVYNRFARKMEAALDLLDRSFLTEQMRDLYRSVLEIRGKTIGL